MECQFVVGQRVVCIVDTWKDISILAVTSELVPTSNRVPMINEVLTIRSIMPVNSWRCPKNSVALFFEEIPDGWDHTNFRPLTDKKSDIGLFQSMLTPHPDAPRKSEANRPVDA